MGFLSNATAFLLSSQFLPIWTSHSIELRSITLNLRLAGLPNLVYVIVADDRFAVAI
jgi:hypothetical protein